MLIDIKVLGPDDAFVLDRVAPDVFDDPIDVRRAKEFLNDPRHHLAVAVDGGVVIGFVSAVHYVHPDKPRPELWINEVSVAATHRQRGLGTRLLRCMLDTAPAWAAAKPGCSPTGQTRRPCNSTPPPMERARRRTT
jgi:GNAT superfamily N-acetyltransferase